MQAGHTSTFDLASEQRWAELATAPVVVVLNILIGAAFLVAGEPLLAALDGIAALLQALGGLLIYRRMVVAGLWMIFLTSMAHIFFWVGSLGLAGGWAYYVLNCVLAFYLTLRGRPRHLIAAYTLLATGTVGSVAIAITTPPLWSFDAATDVVFHVFNLGLVVAGQLVGISVIRRIGAQTESEMISLREQVAELGRLGQYTLEEKIGEGGMGQVYRASHALLRRPTAVKLLPQSGVDPTALRRFEREVQLTSELTCPNTIAIYDFGHTPEGVFYYVMEYLDGLDLQSLVDRYGPQPPERVVHILRQALEALEEAHNRGLVHRDIKPGNIMLCERGRRPDVVKVLDFGLVKDLQGEGATTEGVIAGTPAYLSPEAIEDPARLGPASDLYALGAVGYFLLTGETVFSGKTLAAICAAHLHQVPTPIHERVEGPVPEVLEELILACLEKDAAHRPRDAEQLRHQLGTVELSRPWGEADAREWWQAHRAEPSEERATERSEVDELSMTVELRGRRGLGLASTILQPADADQEENAVRARSAG